jgi:hypothetical protein
VTIHDGDSVLLTFAELAALAPKAGIRCALRRGEFLTEISYDDLDQGNMEEVEVYAEKKMFAEDARFARRYEPMSKTECEP